MPNTRLKKPGTRCIGAYCAVYGCSNYHGKTRLMGISYHSFPRNPELRKLWIKKCRRADEWNPSKSRICSDHFNPDDFRRDFKAELMQCPKINQLKTGAVPSRKLPQVGTYLSASTGTEAQQNERLMNCKRIDNETGSGAVNEVSIIYFRYRTATESPRPLLIEVHTETSESNRVSSRTSSSCLEDRSSDTSGTELEDGDFSLKTDIGRLEYLVRKKDNEISALERDLVRSSREKRKLPNESERNWGKFV